MKIIFLCSSLAPGKDGVGDYCRKMAANLACLGNESVIIALNDKFLSANERKEFQYDEKQEILTYRYSYALEWKQKIEKLKLTNFTM